MKEPVLFVTLEHDGKNLSAEEFLELAEQNGAILTPEQTVKGRQESVDWFSRYQFYTGLFGDWHVIDTHAWDYKIYKFVTGCIKFCFGLFLLFLSAFLLFTLLF
jgi:hypothetical protein